jgi:hypothetical protein
MVQDGQVILTTEECRRLRADALLECEEAQLELSRLLVMARQASELWSRIGVGLGCLQSVNDTGNAERDVAGLLERNRDRLSSTDAEALVSSILAARERLKNARRDKASLQVS